MVVIGLIIAAVMKGKDVIKGAEVKETNQNFMGKWVSSFDIFYDKMGYNPYGTTEFPMINLDVNGTLKYVTCVSSGDSDSNNTNNIIEEMQTAGIAINNLVKTDTGDICNSYIAGEFTEDKLVTAHFDYISINGVNRNVIMFDNVPVDVAKSFDKLVDSVINGSSGKVIAIDSGVANADYVTTQNGSTTLPDASNQDVNSTNWGTVTDNAITNVVVVLEH
jgi:hypothetical protein